MTRFASAVGRPSSGPELMLTAFAGEGLVRIGRGCRRPGVTTCTIGMPNFLANSKSRSSWAGTAMMAPVP